MFLSLLACSSTGSWDFPSVMIMATFGKPFLEPPASVKMFCRRWSMASPADKGWIFCYRHCLTLSSHICTLIDRLTNLSLSGPPCTCHRVSTLVWKGVDGLKQISSSGVLSEGELCPGVRAVLDHCHTGLVLANVEGTSQGGDEAADVFEVFPAHAPRAVHKESQICYCADRTL